MEETARRRPRSPALDDGSRVLTYGQLLEQAERISIWLRRVGVDAGDCVAIHAGRSIGHVVGTWGCLLAGATYVPVDPRAPGPWLEPTSEWIGLSAAVCDATTAPWWVERSIPVVAPDDAAVESAPNQAAGGALRAALTAAQSQPIASIYLTSGTTGVPKGVTRTHAGVAAAASSEIRALGLRADDRLASFAPLHFSLAARDIFLAASAGATLVLPDDRMGSFGADIAGFTSSAAVTVLTLLPGQLETVGAAAGRRTDLRSLRIIGFGGEPPPLAAVRALRDGVADAELHHFYGSTETNRVSDHPVPKDGELTVPLPIGRPLPGVELLVVGDNGSLAAPGELGELYVAALSLSPGYWRDEESTARAFVAHPRDPGRLAFRTGDLADYDADGVFRVHGRREGFVKSRGYRVEPVQVEAALCSHTAVREAAVVVADDGALVGHVVLEVADTDAVRPPEEVELRRWLAARLPRHLVPMRLETHPQLPRTPRGKVDRTALAARPPAGPA